MMLKKTFINLLVILLAILTLCPSTILGKDKTIIKVGYARLTGFLYEDEANNYTGMAYDLLQEIGIYNNWEYEYVETTYSDAKKLLENGTIDIFIPYQKTEERAKLYEYSNQVFCTNQATLLTLPQSQIYFEDFSSMEGKRIGVVKNTRNGERFANLFKENNTKVTIIDDYLSQSQLINALKNGEIDAFISASKRGIDNCKIVYILPQTNSFVIGPKGNRTILDQVDSALEKINTNSPNLINSLDEKYNVPEKGSYPSFTKEEADYLAENHTIKVLVDSQESDGNGNLVGSSKTIYDLISKMSGLKFVANISTNTSNIMDDFANGDSDIIFSFNHDYHWADVQNVLLTQPYITMDNKLITKATTTKINKVAAVANTYFAYYLENYTDYKIIYCNRYEQAINLVLNNTVDATFCNSLIGSYYSTFAKYSSLTFSATAAISNEFCMAINKNSDLILVSIINKCIQCIPKTTLSDSFNQQLHSREFTFVDFFYSNTLLVIVIFIIIIILIVSLISSYILIALFRKKNLQLEKANQAKSEFLTRMSHDMRTPMNAIIGFSDERLRENISEQEKDDYLTKIHASGNYLLNLINDVLDMAKIEKSGLELHVHPQSLRDCYRNTKTIVNPLAQEKGVNLIFNIQDDYRHEYVYLDNLRTQQIFINLLNNAIKFTPQDGTVTFTSKPSEVVNKTYLKTFIISDTGCGMSEEFQKTMFDEFSQENENQSLSQGTGLGLSIVKALVSAMGGKIKVASKKNQGTTFTITIPFKIAKDYHPQTSSTNNTDPTINPNHLRLLLCEDHDLNAQIAIKLLEKVGYQVDRASDGEMGVQMFISSAKDYYAAILMDIRMPKKNGYEATKDIRNSNHPQAQQIPIIAMTANAFDEDVNLSKEAGMNGHISKPVDPKALYATINEQINKEYQNE